MPNRDGWVANASADPKGAERAIWAVRTAGGPAWRVAEGTSPELAPDGSSVLYLKEGEIYRAVVCPSRPIKEMDRGEKPFIRNWGVQSAPRWSPDGKKIAFVTTRQDHSFIAVLDLATRKISYMDPSVDFDTTPLWTPDSNHIIFFRRPGTPFGQQGQQGGGGIGIPNGPAFNANQGRGRGNQGNQAPGAPDPAQQAATQAAAKIPGLMRATFRGGHTLIVMKATVATGEAEELWHNEPDDRLVSNINNPRLAGNHIVFPFNIGGGGRGGGRGHAGRAAADRADRRVGSLLLARTEAGRAAGAADDDRRSHRGPDLDQSLARRQDLLLFDQRERHRPPPHLGGAGGWWSAGADHRRQGDRDMARPVGVRKDAGDAERGLETSAIDRRLEAGGHDTLMSQQYVFPTAAQMKTFPTALHVEPKAVMTKAADGVEVPNQLFLPPGLKPGEKRPAIIFVHGGPSRQMLLGYHYMHFYHWAYGINQWLANKGYVVMSVNYRSGIGYGNSFRRAPNTGQRGNSEYQDVLAGGKYLQTHPNVDPNRIGIWGLSYGGVLTAQALARNSDIFKMGVDLAGVHLWGSSVDPESVSFKSSAIGAIDGWKSPVLLVHGDDDRNVAFQQTTGLVQLLRARNVEYELIVFPDDTHESMLHSRWIYTLDRMEKFIDKHLGGGKKVITSSAR